nr:unnamed protein product [uncultured bacterium]
MNRNVESHFSRLPSVDISRSQFDRSSSLKTTFNVGDLIPFYIDEVLPGDTFNVKSSKVIRMQSLVTPIMDNIYLDTYYFFVPNRLVWSHWQQFNGENTESAWLPTTEYQVPQVTAPANGWSIGTIADYFGIPTGVACSVNALPFRAYALICNEWFRDENLSDPLNIPISDATVVGSNGDNYITDIVKGGMPFKACKYHDYFTSCLPAPQKGPDVLLPLSSSPVPVTTSDTMVDPLQYSKYPMAGVDSWNLSPTLMRNIIRPFEGVEGANYQVHQFTGDIPTIDAFRPLNLVANLQNATAASINQLRLAFQIQRLYERDARGGTRYIEILKSHFGVTSPDARLQRPEYLGGNRIPININQVLQQSETTSTSPQGNPVGQSLTTDTNADFVKSFVEHGFVIGLMVARYDHTYQQGLERFWSRKDRFDYYWPVFAHIGEQAVLNKEIYTSGTAVDDEVFGYQEAYADYRYKPSRVTGEMRSAAPQSLDVWHLADDYASLPSLSDSWIRESASTVDRVLAVSSNVSAQLFCDIYIQNRSTRPMPMYSVPGLIDHF